MLYACSCPFYQENEYCCKHVWATLLAAETAGLLTDWEQGNPSFDAEATGEIFPDDFDSSSESEEESDAEEVGPRGPINERMIRMASVAPKQTADWKRQLDHVRAQMRAQEPVSDVIWPAGREMVYLIDVARTLSGGGLAFELAYRDRKKDGTWSKLKRESITDGVIKLLPDPVDREILSMLFGADDDTSGYFTGYYQTASRFRLNAIQLTSIVKRACQSGRCMVRTSGETGEEQFIPVEWDDGPPWKFVISVEKDESAMRYVISGKLARSVEDEPEQEMPLSAPIMLVEGGVVVTQGAIAPLDDAEAFAWIVALREQQAIRVPIAQASELLEQMLSLPRIAPMQLPSELSHERVEIRPTPRLTVKRLEKNHWNGDRLEALLSFDYGGQIISYTEESSGIFQPATRRFIVRDRNAEREAMARLLEVGVRGGNYYGNAEVLQIAPNSLPAIVRKLTSENWHIEADGKLYRQPGTMKIEVSSGVDWFELHGSADFDGQTVKLPVLLAALRKGDKTVVLDDGSLGVLPEEWLRKYGALASMGTEQGDHLEFRRAQIGLLDALLASQPEATCDAVFQQARERLMQFEGIAAANAPSGFIGSLRPTSAKDWGG